MTTAQIERRRRWIELIELELAKVRLESSKIKNEYDIRKWYLDAEGKRLLSLLRRVRRCPECKGIGAVCWEAGNQRWEGIECVTCGGTGKL